MASDSPKPVRYLLLESVLASKGLQPKALYKLTDVAQLFGVSVRSIQERTKRGQLNSRNLPGHAKFLPLDIEEFIKNSSRPSSPAS
jgi:hypothetical protein